jgi:hypothetical protein
MLASLLLSVWIPAAHAQACDGAALEKALLQAAPAASADAYLALVACDPVRGLKDAGTALRRIVGSDTNAAPAAAAALRLGATDAVRTWISTLEPEGRSRVASKLGGMCDQEPAIGVFFAKLRADLGDDFFDQRWHRGIDKCRTPEVRALLTDALSSPTVGRGTRNRTQFASILDVYARNLGAEALPKLTEYLTTARDDEEASLMLGAFGEASNIGGAAGTNADTAKASVAAIVAAAPKLGPQALVRARGLLVSLDDQAASDALAVHRWRDRLTNGVYTYGVAAVEEITCKNGDVRLAVHLGSFTEAGAQWPDQLAAKAAERLPTAWTFDGAAKCKGTETLTVTTSVEPLSAEGLAIFQKTQADAAKPKVAAAAKAWTVQHDVFAW